ncbi:Bacteriophage phiKZ, Orf197 [uncultured Caudovirales phage]|uniref:Bacteriophage phiKZ, Orf197 n=1 Tax=uncultured Caudovirales phage TaxID=2100421 RepID=A0A6J5RB55_9CAUD|nr:Bacteriophage phiKZ, Orf197 [uncultured Caudovirales phage]
MSEQIVSAVIGHLFGDYVTQDDRQAMNKKKPGWYGFGLCLTHCLCWSLSVCAFGGITSPIAFLILLVTHFIQDRTNIVAWWMDFRDQNGFRTGPLAPWSTIVVDNVLHIVTIFLVCRSGV